MGRVEAQRMKSAASISERNYRLNVSSFSQTLNPETSLTAEASKPKIPITNPYNPLRGTKISL